MFLYRCSQFGTEGPTLLYPNTDESDTDAPSVVAGLALFLWLIAF